MDSLLFFSNNTDKIKEIKKLFRNVKAKIVSPVDINLKFHPKETGNSFSQNAKIKSMFGYNKSNMPCFADDSGICVEALNWKPGVISKEFINGFSNHKECFKYIIEKASKTGRYKAYFKTSICYTYKGNYHIVFEGKVEGTISKSILGESGFGYDPIFIPHGTSKTFGQLNTRDKNLLSHRSVAIRKFIDFLPNQF